MKVTATSSNVTSMSKDASAALVTERPHGPASDAMAPVQFTQRQREVLSLLCEGLPTKLICRQLNIAAGTVKVHIRFILRKLGVSSRLQAVVAAHRCGLFGESGVSTSGHATGSPPAGQPTVAAGAPDSGTSRRVAMAA